LQSLADLCGKANCTARNVGDVCDGENWSTLQAWQSHAGPKLRMTMATGKKTSCGAQTAYNLQDLKLDLAPKQKSKEASKYMVF